MSRALRYATGGADDEEAEARATSTPAERLVWGCLGKAGLSHAEAQRIAKRARRRRGERVIAYHCRRCRCWHIGHTDRSRR